MVTKVGINGFGRIGRQVLKAITDRHGDVLEVVAINDLVPIETNANLLKYDSNYGQWKRDIRAEADGIAVDGRPDQGLQRARPRRDPMGLRGRRNRDRVHGLLHRRHKGARTTAATRVKKVIISAPAKNEDFTVVLGVNQEKYDPREAQRHFERELHDQRAGAGGEGARRQPRRGQGPDDDHPQLHQLPEDPRPGGRRRPPRDARRRPQHRPHVHRRGEGAAARHPRDRGQARRPLLPRAHANRLHRRSRRPHRTRHDQGGSQCRC